MTTQPEVFRQFGYTLAFAERTLTETLRQHLAERDIEPETWYALRLIATRSPGAPSEALIHDLEGSRGLDADSTRELLVRLDADGLIRGRETVDLTPEGEALFLSLREYIAAPAAELLGQFDVDDIETTVRTLQAVAERAATELLAPSSG